MWPEFADKEELGWIALRQEWYLSQFHRGKEALEGGAEGMWASCPETDAATKMKDYDAILDSGSTGGGWSGRQSKIGGQAILAKIVSRIPRRTGTTQSVETSQCAYRDVHSTNFFKRTLPSKRRQIHSSSASDGNLFTSQERRGHQENKRRPGPPHCERCRPYHQVHPGARHQAVRVKLVEGSPWVLRYGTTVR